MCICSFRESWSYLYGACCSHTACLSLQEACLLQASAGRGYLTQGRNISVPLHLRPLAGTLHSAAGRRSFRPSHTTPSSPTSRSRCPLWTARASAGCCRPRWRCSSLCCSQVGCSASQLGLSSTAQAAPELRVPLLLTGAQQPVMITGHWVNSQAASWQIVVVSQPATLCVRVVSFSGMSIVLTSGADAERVAVANHACKTSKPFDLPWQVALEWARLPWSRACCASRPQADRQCLSCSTTVPKPPALQPSRSLRAAWRSCAKTGASCRAAMFRVANTWQS